MLCHLLDMPYDTCETAYFRPQRQNQANQSMFLYRHPKNNNTTSVVLEATEAV
jgi:hypothetical protein